MQITFQNIPAVVQRMEDIRRRIVERASKKAVLAGANVIAEAMASRAPISPPPTPKSNALAPGELKADIHARPAPAENGAVYAYAGPSRRTAYVARFVEWGHRNVRGGQSKVLASGKTTGPGKVSSDSTPAYPFLRPAFEESLAEAKAARDKVLRDALKKG